MIKTQDYLREFVNLFFIQKNIILSITIIFFIAAILVALFWPPIYSSTGAILVKRNQPLKNPESIENVRTELSPLKEDDLLTEEQILKSHTVIEKTVHQIHNKRPSIIQNFFSERKLQRVSNKILSNLYTELVPNSNVINVQFNWGNPQQSEYILDSLFKIYLDYRSELYNPKEAKIFFKNQLHNFNNQLKNREEELIKLAEKYNLSAPMEQIKSNLLLQENLGEKLIDLRKELTEKSKYIQCIQKSLQSRNINFFTSVDDKEIGDFGKRIHNLIMKKEDILQLYTKQSLKAKRINDQINGAYQKLKSEVQRYINAQKTIKNGMQENISKIESKIQNLEKRNVDLYKNMVRSNRINREINLLEDSYSTFAKRLEESQITAKSQAGKLFSVSILSKPQAQSVPIFPNKRKVMLLGLLLGLIVGSTVGFLIEFFNHSFKRPEDVYNYTSLQHIYSIPKM